MLIAIAIAIGWCNIPWNLCSLLLLLLLVDVIFLDPCTKITKLVGAVQTDIYDLSGNIKKGNKSFNVTTNNIELMKHGCNYLHPLFTKKKIDNVTTKWIDITTKWIDMDNIYQQNK